MKLLREKIDLPVIPISAKVGTNISRLLKEIRILYDTSLQEHGKKDETQQDLA